MKREILFRLPSWALLLGALASLTVAQDSTSLTSAIPGDALDAHDNTEQVNDFVVDLTTFESSYGYTYGVAPLSKTSMYFAPTPWEYSADFYSQSISNSTRIAVPFPRTSYDYWNTAGAGINGDPGANSPGTPIDTSLLVGNQFGYVIGEISTDYPDSPSINFNQVVGGTVNYEMSTPSRLYVSRVVAATGAPGWSCNGASFGVGAVGADGVISFRADEHEVSPCGGFNPLPADNWYTVDLLARNAGLVNLIHDLGSGDSGSVTRLLVNGTPDHCSPAMIPSDVTGGLPILMGVTWDADYVYGSSTLTTTTAHLAGAGATRGSTSYSQHNFPGVLPGSTLGTGAVITQNGGNNTLGLYGLDNSGAPVGAKGLQLPSVLVDNDDGWQSDALGTGYLSLGGIFWHTFWRGGNGQIAVGKDQSGRLLAAAMVHHPAYVGSTNSNNLIAVARTTDGTNVGWTIAAWNANNDGKVVYGAFGTTPIGKIVADDAAGSNGGPSLSSPMIDSVGNVYFMGRVELTGQEFKNGLVRAVYDEATFSFRLELLLMEGSVFHGQNSDVDYQINQLFINDPEGSSAAMTTYSGNMNQDAYTGLDPATVVGSSPKSLGGIVVGADIIYDTSDDGSFDIGIDQDYSVLLYVTSAEDCNDNGVPDDIDIADGTSTDIDLDGIPDECGAGEGYCYGDGTGTGCPCGNTGGSGEGCANSTGSGGILVGTGSNSVLADDISFTLLQALPSQGALLFVANDQLSGLLFGDGLRCAGGGLIRLGVRIPNGSGTATWASGMAAWGGWASGDTRNFQAWYRDPGASPCANEFNTSNGVSVLFAP